MNIEKLKAFLKTAGFAAVLAYGSIVFLLWLLQWWVSEAVPAMGLVKSLLQLLLLPSLILLPIFLLMRRWRMAFVLVPAVVAFLFSYGPFLLPRTQTPPQERPVLHMMSFNLQAPDQQAALALGDIIRSVDADVVAVQELSAEAAAALADALQSTYPYQALHPQPDHAGQGVFSRYPIVSDDYWRYTELSGALGHQRIEFEFGGSRIILYNSHIVPPITMAPEFNTVAHSKALQDLLQRVEQDSGKILMAGDFNMTDQFHGYRAITARFTDVYRAVGDIGFGFTYPHKGIRPLPALLRLDYIFYDKSFVGVSADVWRDSGPSDHAPLVARLTLMR